MLLKDDARALIDGTMFYRRAAGSPCGAAAAPLPL